ncbi:hypothetical protein AMR74_16400 [Halorubrum tropicale]|uniref:Uncharacterized protein n=1 Tax=Halorubrum tropicale TaxID=1765655 RepID=A0A0M9ALL9_9EURY|nr:hypothetical protein AMR74_16400 [Halorubrum tropicale]
MQSSGPIATRVVALCDLFREVVAVLLQAVAGVEVSFFRAVRDRGNVTDPEIDASCFLAGRVRCFHLFGADEMEFPPTLLSVVDSTNLLQVLDGDAGRGFVLDKDVLPRFRVFLVIGTL